MLLFLYFLFVSPLFSVQSSANDIVFVNVARQANLNAKTIYGEERKNKYLLETTGCGVAFLDYDNDDLMDIFLVNGHVYPDLRFNPDHAQARQLLLTLSGTQTKCVL